MSLFFFLSSRSASPAYLPLRAGQSLGRKRNRKPDDRWHDSPDDAACQGATTIKSDDVGRMKFRGFPRTSRRRLWINRIALRPKWKPESAARMLSEISAYMPLRAYVYQLCVLPRGTGLSPGWQNVRQKLRARTEKVYVPLVLCVQTIPLVEFFFVSIFQSAG